MKNMHYKQFISNLPVDTKTVIDYAFSIFRDIEKKNIYINKQNKKINEIDKAYLSLFIALLTINTNIKTYFFNNDVDREMVLEFLESYNDRFILPIDMKSLFEDEKEQVFIKNFSFLEKIINDKKTTPEELAIFLFNNNDLSPILDIFFKETYNAIEIAKEHKSIKGLCLNTNEFEKKIENKVSVEFIPKEKKKEFIRKEEIKKEEHSPELSILDEYGINYSKKEKLHTAISREQEIRNILIALKTPSKRSVILVGPTGVGKKTIVESFAKELKEGKSIPEEFKLKEIIEIDISSIIAGTSFRGQLEERIKTILDLAKNNRNIILFINDIHKGINSSEEDNKIDIVSMLNNYLSRGEISLIATSTKEAYENIILPNNISTKLWKISVEEPSQEVVEEILYSSIAEMIELTNIEFPKNEERDFLIKIIADTTSKDKRGYFSSGNNPDLAKSMLERTFAIASINNHQTVEKEDLIEAIETDESISKEARMKQASIIRQNFNNKEKTNNNIVKLRLIK